jgi:hypothetical protein
MSPPADLRVDPTPPVSSSSLSSSTQPEPNTDKISSQTTIDTENISEYDEDPNEDATVDVPPKGLNGTKAPQKKLTGEIPCTSHSVARSWCHRKASPYSADAWVALSLTLEGRDSTTKFLQYGSRLVAHQLRPYDAPWSQAWQALYTNLATSRKAFRLGRSVVEVQKLRKLGVWAALLMHIRGKNHKDNNNKDNNSVVDPKQPLWNTLGMALKTIGLFGYWAADNITFLTSIGFLDNVHSDNANDRILERKRRQQEWGSRTNQSYFVAAVAGLYVNFRMYCIHQRCHLAAAHAMLNDAITPDQLRVAQEHLQTVKDKQFQLLLDLIKSCCDVMVFSNNTGVNLWEKYRGRKLNEWAHCIGGMTSSAVVLYNNYPNHAAAK